MTYTNKFGISQEIYNAIVARQKQYDSGEADFSATELIDTPRRVQLKKRHIDEIEVDVSSLLESWKGHLIHDALETPQTSDRLYTKVCSSVICGAFDYYKDGFLKDYKTISVWNVLAGSPHKKWREQLGIYQFLLQYHRMPVERMGIEAIFKDWLDMEAKRQGRQYPPAAIHFYEQTIYNERELRCLVESRVGVHERAMMMMDDELPACTEEEMWAKPTTYAIVKKGNQRASKVYSDEFDPQITTWDMKYYNLVPRPGERTRCEKYCECSSFCSQYQEYKNGVDSNKSQ